MLSAILITSALLLGQSPDAQARAALALAKERQAQELRKANEAPVEPEPEPEPEPAHTYAKRATLAHSLDQPIIVYIGCPDRKLSGTVSFNCSDSESAIFEDLSYKPGIVVGRANGTRVDLPAKATDADIRKAINKVLPKSQTSNKAPKLGPIGNDCGCHFGQACRCLNEGRRCQCNGIRPPTSEAPPAPTAPRSEFITLPGNTVECQS